MKTAKRCPQCKAQTVKVTRSRDARDGRRRAYSCRACGHRWTSLEVIEGVDAIVFDATTRVIEALEAALAQIKALR